MVLESLKQPVINGYLIAGSLVGPGGFKLVKVCLPQILLLSLPEHGLHLILPTLTFVGCRIRAQGWASSIMHITQLD